MYTVETNFVKVAAVIACTMGLASKPMHVSLATLSYMFYDSTANKAITSISHNLKIEGLRASYSTRPTKNQILEIA